MEIYKNDYETRYNLQHRPVSYNIGDIVWLEVSALNNKIAQDWSGPFRIYARPSETVYLIHDAEGKPHDAPVSVRHLKPVRLPDMSFDSFDQLPVTAPVVAPPVSSSHPILSDHYSTHPLPLSSTLPSPTIIHPFPYL